jgi:hypothetical protein
MMEKHELRAATSLAAVFYLPVLLLSVAVMVPAIIVAERCWLPRPCAARPWAMTAAG